MILNGELFAELTGAAGEGGHMTIDLAGPLCGCGKRGCVEVYASGTAVGRQARERLENPVAGARMLAAAGGAVDKLTAEIVTRAAYDGDPLAQEILQSSADRSARWLGGVIDLLEPEAIVIGGGFGRATNSAPRAADARQAQDLGDQSESQARENRQRAFPLNRAVGAAALWLAQK